MHPVVEKLLAALMRIMPVKMVSDIGAWFGRREVLSEQAKQRRWVELFNGHMQSLCGITDTREQQLRLLEFGAQIGRVYSEFTILQRIDKQGLISITGLEHLQGRTDPAIFVAPHMSNWEVGFKLFADLDIPVCQLYEPRESEQRMAIANRCRLAWSDKVQLLSTSEPMVMKKIHQLLKQGVNLYILPDEESDDYVHAPSLGRDIPYSGNRWMISRLAVKMGIDIIPFYVERVSAVKFVIHINPIIRPERSLPEEMAAKQVADRIDALFDQWVRSRLEHWYWLSYLDSGKAIPRGKKSL